MNLYFDNAATSYPKPSTVYNATYDYMKNIGSNPGRSAHANSINGDKIIYNTREIVADFFNFDKLDNVIFTLNVTHALNILIKSVIKPGWQVITTSMEHNSVLRPLHALKSVLDYDLDIVKCSKEGVLSYSDFISHINDRTKLVILSQCSNVVGSIQPIKEIGTFCKKRGIYLIVDGAQSAGSIPVDFKELNCNAFCFTGHKGLLGPQGTGGFLIDDTLNNEATTFYQGGSGSNSSSLMQPDFLPDKFECGTMNAPGIAGLYHGIKYINDLSISYIKEYETNLSNFFLEKISNMDGIKLYGLNSDNLNRTPVFSINVDNMDASTVSYYLDKDYGISCRSGLHCAPLAHETIGSGQEGTLRFSFNTFNNLEDIIFLVDSINKIKQAQK